MLSLFRNFRQKLGVRRRYHTWRAHQTAGKVGAGVLVQHKSLFTRKTHIADHANFNGMVVAGNGNVTIGRYFHSGRECLMITSFHNYDKGSCIPYGPNEDLDKDIQIGDFVWIGDRVTILGGTTIGEGAIIQAGSVVVSDIPSLAIAGGHPARVFSQRDAQHFHRLKAAQKFF